MKRIVMDRISSSCCSLESCTWLCCLGQLGNCGRGWAVLVIVVWKVAAGLVDLVERTGSTGSTRGSRQLATGSFSLLDANVCFL